MLAVLDVIGKKHGVSISNVAVSVMQRCASGLMYVLKFSVNIHCVADMMFLP